MFSGGLLCFITSPSRTGDSCISHPHYGRRSTRFRLPPSALVHSASGADLAGYFGGRPHFYRYLRRPLYIMALYASLYKSFSTFCSLVGLARTPSLLMHFSCSSSSVRTFGILVSFETAMVLWSFEMEWDRKEAIASILSSGFVSGARVWFS